jgi:outer membrane protein TolC
MAQDMLKGLLSMEESSRTLSLHIVPTETPPEPPSQEEATLEDAIQNALKNRPEYRAAKRDIETRNLQIKVAENQLLPSLDLRGGIGLNGLGGNSVPVGESTPLEELLYNLGGLPAPVESPWGGGAKRSFNELFDSDTYQWNFGVRFEYPLENTSARANYRQAKMEAYKSLWRYRSLEQKIILEVKEAWRSLQINRQKIRTSQTTQKLAREQLEAEHKRLSLGLTTNYQVLKMEEDLRNAQISALMARAEYWKAKARLYKAEGILLEMQGIPFQKMLPIGSG